LAGSKFTVPGLATLPMSLWCEKIPSSVEAADASFALINKMTMAGRYRELDVM
jgi:hypothetical protein